MHMWSTGFYKGTLFSEEIKSFKKMVLKLNSHIQKNEVGPLPHTMYEK